MTKKNIFYAQSGGVTAVINATACGVIETARKFKEDIGTVYAGRDGILGALREDLIDTSQESDESIAMLRHTPAGAFGSCRYQLPAYEENPEIYQRLIDVFAAHNIGYFFYNGGGDSQDTANKVAKVSKQLGYPITCIGLPKTVDNDLPITDNCPGFGSVAKYIAISIREAGLDVASMSANSTKVFIMEVMGRHAGWIAAAGGLAQEQEGDAPHIILFPERTFNAKEFLQKVDECVKRHSYCAIVTSEGIKNGEGNLISNSGLKDAFGNAQLGGVAPLLANLIQKELGYKYHWALVDYLQRAARHIASKTDVDQAYALGKTAVERALAGKNAIMLTIERIPGDTYLWKIGETALDNVALVEQPLPDEYITQDGYHITQACRDYMAPLIQGEDYPPYKNGLPQYARLKNIAVPKKLEEASIV